MQDKRIGITTTIPVEAVYAAGYIPVDLNNRFITSQSPERMIEEAELSGFPRNICAWIKGIYTAARAEKIQRIIAVAMGDCSNTHALAEIYETEGIEIIDFSYPYRRQGVELEAELRQLCGRLGTTLEKAEAEKARLDEIRRVVRQIDLLTWKEGKVSGEENHLWQINCSDFGGAPKIFFEAASAFLDEAKQREPSNGAKRIAVIGIPPICSGLYGLIETLGGKVVFNEMQRQFSMPYETRTLLEQYQRYTYPYDVFFRLDDIEKEVALRQVDGVIHYVQSFCFRGIQDKLIRSKLRVPVLTLDFDRPGPVDARSRTRIEAFMEMLRS